MAEWICRHCEGGFPYPIIRHKRAVCPWCAQPIGKPLGQSDAQKKRIIEHYNVPKNVETVRMGDNG